MNASSEASAGREVTVEWRGRKVNAWVPTPLTDRDFGISPSTMLAAGKAVTALRIVDLQLPHSWEALARLLLRHEGIASSRIEGLHEPITEVLIAERVGRGGAPGWVADNLGVIDAAIETAHSPLNLDVLNEWHAHLMRNSDLPGHLIGRLRNAQGWVGGTSPHDAAHVPPPPSELHALMEDLIRFADADHDLDAVTRAAIAHAQFEVIHPYGDGNGRLGRVLVSRILRREGAAQRSVAPISMSIARDPGGYLSGLALFKQGQADAWVRWFAATAERSAALASNLIVESQHVLEQWEQHTKALRSDSAARALLAHLPGHPVINAQDAARLVSTSERSARAALKALAGLGVLAEIRAAAGRAPRWYAAEDLLRLWGPSGR